MEVFALRTCVVSWRLARQQVERRKKEGVESSRLQECVIICSSIHKSLLLINIWALVLNVVLRILCAEWNGPQLWSDLENMHASFPRLSCCEAVDENKLKFFWHLFKERSTKLSKAA